MVNGFQVSRFFRSQRIVPVAVGLFFIAIIGLIGLPGFTPNEQHQKSTLDGSEATSIRKVYWVDIFRTGISRSNLDGTDFEVLRETFHSIADLELDRASNRLYWADTSVRRIMRGNPEDGSFETVLADSGADEVGEARHLELDSATQTLYWVSRDDAGSSIRTASYTGANPQVLYSSASVINGFEIDPANGFLYWTEGTFIKKAPLSLDSITQVFDSRNQVPISHYQLVGLALDHVEERLYFGSTDRRGPFSVDINGDNLTIYSNEAYSGLGRTPSYFLDPVARLIVDQKNRTLFATLGPYGVSRMDLDGEHELTEYLTASTDAIAYEEESEVFYNANVSPYFTFSSIRWNQWIPAQNIDEWGVAIDNGGTRASELFYEPTYQWLYRIENNSIIRSEADLTDETTLFTNLNGPRLIRFFDKDRHLYLVENTVPRTIRRGSMDGGYFTEEVIRIEASNEVHDLAIDQGAGKLYWLEDYKRRNFRIMRANIDGSEVELVRDLKPLREELLYIGTGPNARLDLKNRRLYVTIWGYTVGVGYIDFESATPVIEPLALFEDGTSISSISPDADAFYWGGGVPWEGPQSVLRYDLIANTAFEIPTHFGNPRSIIEADVSLLPRPTPTPPPGSGPAGNMTLEIAVKKKSRSCQLRLQVFQDGLPAEGYEVHLAKTKKRRKPFRQFRSRMSGAQGMVKTRVRRKRGSLRYQASLADSPATKSRVVRCRRRR